jgi:hypothetical protein
MELLHAIHTRKIMVGGGKGVTLLTSDKFVRKISFTYVIVVVGQYVVTCRNFNFDYMFFSKG